jgi:hypothetical protein
VSLAAGKIHHPMNTCLRALIFYFPSYAINSNFNQMFPSIFFGIGSSNLRNFSTSTFHSTLQIRRFLRVEIGKFPGVP